MFGTTSLVAARIAQKQDHRRGENFAGWERIQFNRAKERSSLRCMESITFISKLFEMDLVPKGKGIVPGCGRGYAPRALA